MDCVYSVCWTEWEHIHRFCYGNPNECSRLQADVKEIRSCRNIMELLQLRFKN